jgi:hypothetical protein
MLQKAIARTAKLATNRDMETKAAMSRANAVMINSFVFPLCIIYVPHLFLCQSQQAVFCLPPIPPPFQPLRTGVSHIPPRLSFTGLLALAPAAGQQKARAVTPGLLILEP